MLSELYYSFSLIGLTETKFKVGQPEVTNTNILGYQFISQPSHSMAGGVGFYIKNSISYKLRTDLTTTKDEFEALWIELQNKGKTNVICGVIYRHPSGNLDTFLGYLNSGIEKISQENKICVLMRDFNVDLLKVDSHLNSDKFLNIMGSYFFQPHILQPTRITDHSATLIDTIFLNTLDHFVISGNIVYDLYYHLPNFLIFDKFTSLPSNMKLYKRDYSTLNYEKLVNDVQIIDWSEVLVSELDPSSMFHLFYDQISAIIDKQIPFKQITRKEVKLRSKPWITPAIKRSIQVKNKWHRKFLKTKSIYYFNKFKYDRNKLNHLLKLSKKQYYNNFFLDNKYNTKNLWHAIKQIVHFKPQSSHQFVKIIENGQEITNPKLVVNAFNNHFANIGNELLAKIPNVQNSPLDYLPAPLNNTFVVFPTTCQEIEDIISSFKTGKATGPCSIPINVLKVLKYVISTPLELIFNASFMTGIVPTDFKLANIIPVHKTGSRTDLGNYRPISLLSIFNKILEKLMYNRLLNFLIETIYFFEKRFGFRSSHSIEHAILCIIDKIQKAIDDRSISCGIFLDFSKAFDTVNHEILNRKLEYYGICGVAKDWFTSYLCDRKQVITVNTVTSDQQIMSCGIPQESVLGPILFLLYINDFHLCSNFFEFHLFADDANLFCVNKNISTLFAKINLELSNIHTWLCANKLSLDVKKSKYVIFHPRQKK